MRWLFLLLVVLNVFYAVWHQQVAPMRPKEVASLSLYKGAHQDIKLLSESDAGQTRGAAAAKPAVDTENCLYVGGFSRLEQLAPVEQRLTSLDISSRAVAVNAPEGVSHWLRISPEARRLLDETLLQRLSNDFKDLKQKIMLCGGLQVP
ncbi:hypothetical protein [Pseudomonas sp. RIT-To-2]|uniref:hypothetical protein n=1 Tax=Pseudomonas sp. RIT-To-2 TaxID=3462541 RepID=UPI0024135585